MGDSVREAARTCPLCGADSFVYDTRELENGVIMRRRKCQACGTRFETYETYGRTIHFRRKTQDVVLYKTKKGGSQ